MLTRNAISISLVKIGKTNDMREEIWLLIDTNRAKFVVRGVSPIDILKKIIILIIHEFCKIHRISKQPFHEL